MLSSLSLKGSKSKNEDSILTLEENGTFTLTVSDGHGHSGEGSKCSYFCVEKSKEFSHWLMSQSYQEWDEWKWNQVMQTHYKEVHDEYRLECACVIDTISGKAMVRFIDNGVVRKYDGSAVHSGATYSRTFTFPLGNKYRTIMSHVGDSDIYINEKQVSEDQSPLNEYTYQKVQSIPESDRMIMIYDKKKIEKINCPRVFLQSGMKDPSYEEPPQKNKLILCNVRNEPSSYFISPLHHKDHMCLAMSSAIGDYYGNVMGITYIPIVKMIDTDVIPHIVIGSDGLWNTMNEKQEWEGVTNDFKKLVDVLPQIRNIYENKFKNIDDISIVMLN